jgi:hypothetical protein
MTMLHTGAEFVTLAGSLADGGLIPPAKATKIPGLEGSVTKLFGYGLYILILAGGCGAGYGVFKLAISDKGNRHGGGASEPFKWIGAGIAVIVLSGSLIPVLNGIAG